MSDLEGKTIKGYRLDLTIGVGGFGTVFHATQEVLKREVAVKVIKDKYVNNPQFIRQFETEARIIASLEHFNIVTLYDYWRDPNGAYLVMRWLRGGSLRNYLKHAKLSIPQTVRILNQVASALAFSHQRNVIHRDIKPENILLDNDGNAFLTDFGIAVDLRSQDNDNLDNISFGSPDYVAPEQLKDKIISPQSDIYSLGIMLYELLAQERPFQSNDAKEVIKMQLRNPVPSLHLKRRDLPKDIDLVIWQATAKNPHHRYNNVLELAIAFQETAKQMTDIPSEYLISARSQQLHNTHAFPQVTDLPTEFLVTGSLDTEIINVDDESTTERLAVENPLKTLPTLHFDATLVDKKTTKPDFPDQTPALGEETEVLDTENLETGILNTPRNILMVDGEDIPNPYKGLRPFEETDKHIFFGREHLVSQLLDNFKAEDARFLALIGASGSGKSSLVRAGLIPAFRRGAVEGSSQWFYSTMTPTATPFQELGEALQRVAMTFPNNWEATLCQDNTGLHSLIDAILPDDDSELLLFIDQFEEIFTLVDDEDERSQFLNGLWYAANQLDSRLRLIITLRADFYDRPLLYADFGQMLKEHTEVVLPLKLQELSAAINRPAEQVSLIIDAELTNLILADVHNQPGALPLLQYALTEMYERRKGHRLTEDDYEEIGGVSGALAKRAQEIYSTLKPNEQALARQLFLRIVAIDENGTITRRRVIWSEIMAGVEHPEQFEAVISAFSQYRLLTIDRDQATRTPTIEVAHEALINEWEILRYWIDENSYILQKRQELLLEVERWRNNNFDKSYLASGTRLAEFERLLDNDLVALREKEREYIQDGVYQREAGVRRTRRNNAILSALSVVLLIAAVLAILSFFSANEARADAETQRDIAQDARAEAVAVAQIARSRELAASSIANLSQNDLALLLSAEALNIEQTYEATNGLLLALQENPLVQTYLHGHESWARALDFDSTGTIAVSGGFDNQLIRWDLDSNTMLGEALLGHEFAVNAVAISPDNTVIASASSDETVRLWDLGTGESLAILEEHEAAVWGLAFSNDGTQLATSDENGTIIIWNVAEQTISQHIETAHEGIIYTLSFDSTGSRLASGGNDNAIRVWDTVTGEETLLIEGHNNWVRALSFDSTDSAILAGDLDGLLHFWDANTGEALTEPIFTQHNGGIFDMSFSVNEQFLATAGADGQVFVWDLAIRANRIASIPAHNDSVWSVAFSPTDFRLLSASRDGTIILSELAVINRPGEVIFQANQTLSELAIVSDGTNFVLAGESDENVSSTIQVWDGQENALSYQFDLDDIGESESLRRVVMDMALHENLLAVATSNSEIALWDIATGDLLWSQREHEAIPKALVFATDGQRIYSADESGVVLIWDATTGNLIESDLYAQDNGVTSIALSPNGQYLAIGGRRSILLWDVVNETLIAEMSAHDDAVEALIFDSNSEYLYSGSRDRQIIQWDVASAEALQVLEGHSNWVLSLAISPDNQLLVSGERDTGAVYVWDMATGRQIGTALEGSNALDAWVSAVHFVDTRTLWSSHRETGLISQWTLDVDAWVTQACAIANRSLTESEWAQFFPEQAYSPMCE